MFNIFHAIVLFIVAFLPHSGNVSHVKTATPTPMPTIIIISTPAPTRKPAVIRTQAIIPPTEESQPVYVSPTPKLQDCVLNGKVVELTFEDCQHQLNLEIAQDQKNAQQAENNAQAIQTGMEQALQQAANDQNKIWSQVATPVPTMDVAPQLTQAQEQQNSIYTDEMQTDEQQGASTCREIWSSYSYQVGEQRANAAINGMVDSGVEQSQEANMKQEALNNAQQEFISVSGNITLLGDQSSLTDQANQFIAQLKTACSL